MSPLAIIAFATATTFAGFVVAVVSDLVMDARAYRKYDDLLR